jgi:hypothetical protein
MSNDMGGATIAHNLLFKRDHPGTGHLDHRQKMASILASPQTARKKRFVKLELGSLEANPPARANPFLARKVAEGTIRHDAAPGPGGRGTEGLGSPPSTPTTWPSLTPDGGIPSLYPELVQGLLKGSIDQEAALEIGTDV